MTPQSCLTLNSGVLVAVLPSPYVVLGIPGEQVSVRVRACAAASSTLSAIKAEPLYGKAVSYAVSLCGVCKYQDPLSLSLSAVLRH